jgi:hypothetical protein
MVEAVRGHNCSTCHAYIGCTDTQFAAHRTLCIEKAKARGRIVDVEEVEQLMRSRTVEQVQAVLRNVAEGLLGPGAMRMLPPGQLVAPLPVPQARVPLNNCRNCGAPPARTLTCEYCGTCGG